MTFEEKLDRLLAHQEDTSKLIDRLTERHGALAESVQLLHAETMAQATGLSMLINTVNLLAVKVDALTAVVSDHGKRLNDLEQR